MPHDIAAGEYASALERLHAGMRRVDLSGDWQPPQFTDRVDEAQRLVGDPTNNRALSGADRDLLAMVCAWRCEPGGDLPNGTARARDWIAQLRAAGAP